MDRDILGTATSGKITGAVSRIHSNVFMHLVARHSLKNTIHIVVGYKAKATAVGSEQEIQFLGKPEADPHPHEGFKKSTTVTALNKDPPRLICSRPKGPVRVAFKLRLVS